MSKKEVVLFGIILCCVSVLFGIYFCTATAEHIAWDCPGCDRTGNTGNYCGGCAHPAPWIEDASLKLLRDEFSKVGNIVRFGHYEQDNNLNNGQEEIEWIVLDVQAGKSMLISRYGLDTKPYNTSYINIGWERCTLRKWLNSDFLKAAFSIEEQFSILTIKVDNSFDQKYSIYSVNYGNNTQDRVFLLSDHEAFDVYFKNNEVRKCVPTQYAEAQGAYTNSRTFDVDGRNTGGWWLRSQGNGFRSASYVSYFGSLSYNSVNYDAVCVRPALWINLESEPF